MQIRFFQTLSGRRCKLTCFKTVPLRLFGFLYSCRHGLTYFTSKRWKLDLKITLFTTLASQSNECGWKSKPILPKYYHYSRLRWNVTCLCILLQTARLEGWELPKDYIAKTSGKAPARCCSIRGENVKRFFNCCSVLRPKQSTCIAVLALRTSNATNPTPSPGGELTYPRSGVLVEKFKLNP